MVLRACSHWVRSTLISIKGFSRCARITVTLRFRARRVWIEVGLCVRNVPKCRPPSSYKTRKCRKFCSSSQSGKSCSTSRKELKNFVSEAPSPRGAAPNLVPLLRRVSAFENSSWPRTNFWSCNIDMLLTEKYLTQLSRRPPPPCEAPAYSWQQPCAVSDACLYFTRQHARKEDFQFEKPLRKNRKSPPLYSLTQSGSCRSAWLWWGHRRPGAPWKPADWPHRPHTWQKKEK